jgi:hypothetical protein
MAVDENSEPKRVSPEEHQKFVDAGYEPGYLGFTWSIWWFGRELAWYLRTAEHPEYAMEFDDPALVASYQWGYIVNLIAETEHKGLKLSDLERAWRNFFDVSRNRQAPKQPVYPEFDARQYVVPAGTREWISPEGKHYRINGPGPTWAQGIPASTYSHDELAAARKQIEAMQMGALQVPFAGGIPKARPTFQWHSKAEGEPRVDENGNDLKLARKKLREHLAKVEEQKQHEPTD